MHAFAERTGLVDGRAPKRYLWTDAFAVCNFLALERLTGDTAYRTLALRLVDQVHHVLGRHRLDDQRQGWISGLSDNEGEVHPTIGGLRIGKPLRERLPSEPMDERLEWDRDGQYFHYLTKWMHALGRMREVTGEPRYLRWALELAETAYKGFSVVSGNADSRSLVWKMSTDLSRPLIDSEGQHDPLDGLVTLLELRQAAAATGGAVPPRLERAIVELAGMCARQPLTTADPLGIGGLLTSAHTLAALALAGLRGCEDLCADLLEAALIGLQSYTSDPRQLSLPSAYRLAFRELGVSIGLRAVRGIRVLMEQDPAAFDPRPALGPQVARLMGYDTLIGMIEGFWMEPGNRRCATWQDHEDINAVMLATSLAPDGFLGP
jgi:hypothetical protein